MYKQTFRLNNTTEFAAGSAGGWKFKQNMSNFDDIEFLIKIKGFN